MKEVFNAAPTHPLGCLHPQCVAAEALQATLLLFTAVLCVEMSCSTQTASPCKYYSGLINQGRLQLHYVPDVNIQRASAGPL